MTAAPGDITGEGLGRRAGYEAMLFMFVILRKDMLEMLFLLQHLLTTHIFLP